MYDCIVVGRGLAGTLLSLELVERGATVAVAGQQKDQSSRVAAGLYNPLTGKVPTMTRDADRLFSGLEPYYQLWEQRFSERFLYPMPLYRVYMEQSHANRAAEIENPMVTPHATNPNPIVIKAPWGGAAVQPAGRVDVPVFLDAAERYVAQRATVIDALIDYNDIKPDNDSVIIGNMKAKAVVFCEGAGMMKNPFFGWLPMSPNRGDVLSLKTLQPHGLEHVVVGGKFIIPTAANELLAGATYERNPKNNEPSPEGKTEITDRVSVLINTPYEVVRHRSGIRPATRDRVPFVGRHPTYKQLYVFNGLGSKGVSQGWYAARQMAHLILNDKNPDNTLDIYRYISLYR